MGAMHLQRRFRASWLLGAMIVFGGSAASAQKKPAPQGAAPACPTVNVSCPASAVSGGAPTFSVEASGGDGAVTPTFNWTVSNGTISSGQGTPSVSLDLAGASGSVTATVDVGGYDRSCSTSASCTTSIEQAPQARKVDEYGKLAARAAEARLDNFALELMNDPMAQAHILGYRAHAGRAGDGSKAATKAKDHLVKKRGVDASRVEAVDGGTRDVPTIELWVVPSGAMPPAPTPTVKAKAGKPTK